MYTLGTLVNGDGCASPDSIKKNNGKADDLKGAFGLQILRQPDCTIFLCDFITKSIFIKNTSAATLALLT